MTEDGELIKFYPHLTILFPPSDYCRCRFQPSSRPYIPHILAHPSPLIRTANRIYRRANQLHVRPTSNLVAGRRVTVYFIIASTRHWIPNASPFVILSPLSASFKFSSRHRNWGNASVRVQFRFLIRRANRVYVAPKSRVNFYRLMAGRMRSGRGETRENTEV